VIGIIPHVGAGAIRFGMTRADVGDVVQGVAVRRRRNPRDASEYDFFREEGFFVYYDVADRCVAVEFGPGARVTYDSFELFGEAAHVALAWARSRDPDLVVKDGFVSKAMGLAMYAPWLEHRPESFMIFRPNYDEDEQRRMAAHLS